MRKPFYLFIFSLLLLLISSITLGAQMHDKDLPCVDKNYNLRIMVAVDSTNREPLYSEAQLDNMINRLNQIFDDICVSFSICEIIVMENDYSLGRITGRPIATSQQLEELKTRFSLRRRINIFMLDFIYDEFCGASTFQGILTTNDANIYTERQCGETLTSQVAHHLGHTFGLRDTFDPGSIELVDGSNCATAGDRICDTPADPLGQSNATAEELELIQAGELEDRFIEGCEFIYEIKDPNGEYYQPDVANFMSGYPCKCRFSPDQFRLMVENIRRSDINHF